MDKPKRKPYVILCIGGGELRRYADCEIEDHISPDLTFVGRLQFYPGESCYKRFRIVTTVPYIIEHELEENDAVQGNS